MKIEVEIKLIGFAVLEEKDTVIDTIECVMLAEFGININNEQKASFTERIKATYFNTNTGIEMDEARNKAIDDYISNLTK